MNTLGAAKPSKNVQFDFAVTGFETTNNGVIELENALRGFIVCIKSFHVAGQTLVRVIEHVGGNPENSEETRRFANEIKSSFVQLDGHLLNENVARYEQRVLNPTVGWLARAHALRQQIVAFNEEKLLYDHYTRKVMALREARDKRAAAGKAEKAKDVEKLVRVRENPVFGLVTRANLYSSTDNIMGNAYSRTNKSTQRSRARTQSFRTRLSPTCGSSPARVRTRSRPSCTGCVA